MSLRNGVHNLISTLFRVSGVQRLFFNFKGKDYLDVGCGNNAHAGFFQIDFSWYPHVDLVCDVSKGLPNFKDHKFNGAMCEHMLEHFDYLPALKLLKEIHRSLNAGATFRVVVPDAELYLATYEHRKNGLSDMLFPYEQEYREKPGALTDYTPMMCVNRVFYEARDSSMGHRFMYDFDTLKYILNAAGFKDVQRRNFLEGKDPTLLIDSKVRQCESLYVECVA
jgi:predicted SAM-dependent methyltransferase